MTGLPDRPPPARPRLHRSQQERLLFGVCGGLAQTFGADPTLVRIGFVLAALFPPTTAASLLGYVLLAVILPTQESEHLAGRERLRHNMEELRTELSGLTETVRARVTGESRAQQSVPGQDGHSGYGRDSVGSARDVSPTVVPPTMPTDEPRPPASPQP
ncbi:MAG TPA: PspC domain-containing protein [Chloroflexota bacterium]|jgi:phage shock protein C|nr:PspC domain-containing protein [Chloroflexota bacterium]